MQGFWVLNRLHLTPDAEPALRSFAAALPRWFAGVPGFEGVSLWRDVDLPEGYLLVFTFQMPDGRLPKPPDFADEPEFRAVAERWLSPPDARRFWADGSVAGAPHVAPADTALSWSIRDAGPGGGADLRRELAEELGRWDCAGCLGWTVGSDLGAEELVHSIAWWTGRQAFEASVPTHPQDEIRLYEPMA